MADGCAPTATQGSRRTRSARDGVCPKRFNRDETCARSAQRSAHRTLNAPPEAAVAHDRSPCALRRRMRSTGSRGGAKARSAGAQRSHSRLDGAAPVAGRGRLAHSGRHGQESMRSGMRDTPYPSACSASPRALEAQRVAETTAATAATLRRAIPVRAGSARRAPTGEIIAYRVISRGTACRAPTPTPTIIAYRIISGRCTRFVAGVSGATRATATKSAWGLPPASVKAPPTYMPVPLTAMA